MTDVYHKLLRTEYHRLPQAVRRAYLSPPTLSLPVERVGAVFRLAVTANEPASEALFPKLGIKSWRDSGSLGIIYPGVSMHVMLTVLLQMPTRSQTVAAAAWTRTQTPLHVHLAPYIDFSDISEVRFLVRQGVCQRLSACLRGNTANMVEAMSTQLINKAKRLAMEMDNDPYIIDLGVVAEGTVQVVDINPGLTPKELAMVMA